MTENKIILNLTSYATTPEQIKQGLTEVSEEDKQILKNVWMLNKQPEYKELQERAQTIVNIAKKYDCKDVMLGGPLCMLGCVEDALQDEGYNVKYSFTERIKVQEETRNPETGEVTKAIFKPNHICFINAKNKNDFNEKENVVILQDGILNLTQHILTEQQIKAGVKEPLDKDYVKSLLQFVIPPTSEEILERAKKLADYVQEQGYGRVMIGGASYFDGYLREEFRSRGIDTLYSYAPRNVKIDGQIKTTIHDSKGLVESKNTAEHYE